MQKTICIALLGCLLLVITGQLLAQPTDAPATISWKLLTGVTFDVRYDANAQMEIMVPAFDASVLQWHNKQVELTGYIIPMDAMEGTYALSAFPFAACFFCGGAGPESVVDLDLRTERYYRTDERVTFCGKLVTNPHDPYQLPYRLIDAVPCRTSLK